MAFIFTAFAPLSLSQKCQYHCIRAHCRSIFIEEEGLHRKPAFIVHRTTLGATSRTKSNLHTISLCIPWSESVRLNAEWWTSSESYVFAACLRCCPYLKSVSFILSKSSADLLSWKMRKDYSCIEKTCFPLLSFFIERMIITTCLFRTHFWEKTKH